MPVAEKAYRGLFHKRYQYHTTNGKDLQVQALPSGRLPVAGTKRKDMKKLRFCGMMGM